MRSDLSISLRRMMGLSILWVGLSTAVHAQFRAGIQGAVTDPQGAAVTGATVTLTSLETNRTQQTTSGDEGFYRFDRLPPGNYSVSAEAPGFKKKLLENVLVTAEQMQGVNIQLEAGEVTETVTISGQVAEQLQTENPSIDRSISTAEVLRLPQAGRDPYELVRTAPGVFGLGSRNGGGNSVGLPNTSGPGGSNQSIFQTENQVPISGNGQRVTANGFEIDGVSVNSQAWGGAAVVTPNQESVKEVRVVSSSYSAETGRNTGVLVQVVSQNGTNDFHGSAFFKYNDPSLNAFNRWGGPFGGSPQRVQNRYRQWGGSIGGPIFKDRLFFFFSYETVRNRTNNFSESWIETPEFVRLIQTLRPNSIASQIVSVPGITHRVRGLISRDCASVGLDATRCRQVEGGLDLGSPTGAPGQTIASALGGGLDNIPDLRFAQIFSPSYNRAQQFNGRVDFQATASDLIAFSFYYTPNDNTFSEGGREVQDFLSARRNTSGALLWNRTISPTALNEVRFNVTRWYFNEIESNPNMPWGIPRSAVAFPFCCGDIAWGPGGAGVFYQTTYNFRDTLSKVAGSHGLKFGFEVAREQNNDTVAWAARPSYQFGNLWNFVNDAPIDESGFFDPRTGVPTDLKKYIRSGIYALFAQDDWKVRPNLTLNLGLRWEYFTPVKEKYNNLSNLDLGEGARALLDARVQVGGYLYKPDYNNFGPHLGFAWSPQQISGVDTANRLVLRGGFGIGYNRIPQSVTLNGRLNPPFFGDFRLTGNQILYSLGPSITSFYGFPANPAATLVFDQSTSIPISGAPVEVFATNREVPNPYTYRYSLEAQYELGGSWVASLGYQGSSGRKFPRVLNYSLFFEPNPRFRIARFMQTDVNSNFNALLARLSHRFTRGFEINAQYRFSKSLDTCSNDDNCVQSYPFDQKTEYGPSDYDVKHYFLASGLWDLPIFSGRRDWVGVVLGGWQLNGILTASSGFPWTPLYNPGNCASLINRGNLCPLRPIGYRGGLEQDTSNEAFQRPFGTFGVDASPFFVPPPFGTLTAPPPPGIGRNVFRGPNYFNIDLSLVKRFGLPSLLRLGEGAGIDFRANLFNAFNKLNLRPFLWNSSSTQINNTNFGRATEALSGRVVEFQIRLSF